ncbi:SAM-dependent methyltransferase, MidA family [Roseivivax marinus]|uniref:class I SAM-dependent methyltransferase n=1 Tax=Roseivivax marinus TaxID=1379903 RepID=UPI0008C4CBF7|nr:SAM-dependent methyltransferase [Roseivivax marinus]SEK38860.1 SAM-dependent methyltransferase, MidA family [Roseivivax marinus]
MTPLARVLTERVAVEGPMTLADYMAACLLHTEHGYYATRDPLGTTGDFVTAPEVSQMFGELLGLALAQAWADQGAPARIALAELGPGRGTLMADILRATARVPGFHAAASVHLVEASRPLRARQADTLSAHAPAWHHDVHTLPGDVPLFVVANEFFDALPIRQFQRVGDAWAERMVGPDPEGGLTLGLGAAAPRDELAHRLSDTAEGDVVETCAPATAAVSVLGDRIAAQGGAALLIDYGDWRSLGDTFQAVAGHETVNPFAAPGEADLTAHVDFEALAEAARPAVPSRLTTQGVFLERLGITARAQALARGLSGEALRQHVAAHRRLTHPDEMGTVFKVLGLRPEGAAAIPGLSE